MDINELRINIKEYIKNNLVEEDTLIESFFNKIEDAVSFNAAPMFVSNAYEKESFEPDESFSECLIRMIDEKGLLDPDVYKKANIDRKLFNHIKNDIDYHPSKQTAVALALGMELNIDETDTLLERAGFVLSNSSKFDLIIKYCIENNIYDIYQINEILLEEDQKTLGY